MHTRTKALTALPVLTIFATFIVMGIPSSMLGVAWPSIRGTFELPLDALGALLLAITGGSVTSSFLSGRVQGRLGLGLHLTVSSVILSAGLASYALAPTWPAMVLAGFVTGVGFGGVNAGVNTYAAIHHSARLMNWMHASFGVGATLGPLLMTSLLAAGHSWRWGYALGGAAQLGFAAWFVFMRDLWQGARSDPARPSGAAPAEPARSVRWRDTVRLPLLWVGIGLFCLSSGVQATTGQWSYTLFTESRGIDPTTAGLWAGYYWAAITIGRVFIGFLGDRARIVTLLRASMAGLIVGSALIGWNLTDLVSFLGLVVIGFAVAPMYPLLVLIVPRRLGAEHAPNAIGFQIAAGGVSAALMPGLVGVLAERISLEIIPPFMLVSAALLLALHEVSRRAG